MKSFLLIFVILFSRSLFANFSGEDDFDDNSEDLIKWGTDSAQGSGILYETNQRLEYATSSAVASLVSRPWILNFGSYTENWSVSMDYANTASVGIGGIVSIALRVYDAGNAGHFMSVDAYRAHGGVSYFTAVFSGDVPATNITTGPVLGASTGSLRLDFNASTKVITSFYDIDGTDGQNWIYHGSFGIDGNDGATGNFDWQMNDGDIFRVAVEANSSDVIISSGTVFGDNFFAVPEPHSVITISMGLCLLALLYKPTKRQFDRR